jgi:nucleotide-binding universal stress UspA family protein
VPADHTEPDDADAICYRRILVPLDGSRRAECVLPFAGVLAGQPETQLLLAHVTPRPFVFHRLPPSDNENASMEWLIGRNRARAALYLKEVAARIGPGADTTLPVSDSIELALHQLVADEAVDLVLFSAHGQSGQSQWPYGSVVSNFITNGSAPLLIVQDMPQALDQQSHAQTRGAYSATVWSEVNGRAF